MKRRSTLVMIKEVEIKTRVRANSQTGQSPGSNNSWCWVFSTAGSPGTGNLAFISTWERVKFGATFPQRNRQCHLTVTWLFMQTVTWGRERWRVLRQTAMGCDFRMHLLRHDLSPGLGSKVLVWMGSLFGVCCLHYRHFSPQSDDVAPWLCTKEPCFPSQEKWCKRDVSTMMWQLG